MHNMMRQSILRHRRLAAFVTGQTVACFLILCVSLLVGPSLTQAAAPLQELGFSDLRIIYDNNGTISHNTYAFSSSTGAGWSDPQALLSAFPNGFTVNNIIHVVYRVNPQRKEELAALQADVTATVTGKKDVRVFVFRRASFGSTVGDWMYLFNVYCYTGTPANDRGIIRTTQGYGRAFDLAYEQRSGRAILVTGTYYFGATIAAHELRYWIIDTNAANEVVLHGKSDYNNGVAIDGTGVTVPSGGLPASQIGYSLYGEPANFGGSDAATHFAMWVDLTPRPRSDEVLLTWACDLGELYSVLWVGSTVSPPAWTVKVKLEGQLQNQGNATFADTKAFAAAFGQDGKALLVYSQLVATGTGGKSNCRLRFCILDRGQSATSWSTLGLMRRVLYEDAGANMTEAAAPGYLTLAVEPGSNRMVLGTYTWINSTTSGSNRIYAGIWDCSAAGTTSTNCWVNFTPSGETSGLVANGSLDPVTNQPLTPSIFDMSLIALSNSQVRREQTLGAFPIAVTWVGVAQSPKTALLIYSAEHGTGSATIDWTLWGGLDTGNQAKKWDAAHHDGVGQGVGEEEFSFRLSTLPDTNHAALVYSSVNGTTRIGGMIFQKETYDANPTDPSHGWWHDPKVGINTASSYTINSGAPFSFDVNAGFPKFYSGSGATPENQVFGFNAPFPIRIKPIHIVDPAGIIRRDRNLYIRIPGTIAAQWASATGVMPTCSTAGGSFTTIQATVTSAGAGAVDANVCAMADPVSTLPSHILKVNVTADFSPGTTLVLDGLYFTGCSSLSSAPDKLELDIDNPAADAATTLTAFGTDVFDDGIIRVAERVTLGAASGGQALNAFIVPAVPIARVFGKDLLRVKLTAVGGPVTLNQLVFNMTLTGIVPAEISNLTLNGTAVSINGNGPTVNIPVSFSAATIPTSGTDFILKADVANLDAGDALTVSLAATGVAADGRYPAIATAVTSLATWGLVSGTESKSHGVASYGTVAVSPLTVKAGDPLTVTWGPINANNPTTYEYSLIGSPFSWTLFTGQGAFAPEPVCNNSAAGRCVSTAPTAQATTSGFVQLTGTDKTAGDFIQVASAAAFKVLERVQLSDPGQPANQLNTTSPVTATLLKVALTAKGGPVNVTGLNVAITPSGASPPTLTNYRLLVGNSTVAGPQGTPNFSTLSGSNFQIAQNATTVYELQADVSNLVAGGSVIVKLRTVDITSKGNVTADTLTAEGSPAALTEVAATHTVSTYTVTPGAQVNVNAPWTMTWQSFGTASPTNVTVKYKTHAIGWTDLTSSCTITSIAGGGQCATVVPDQASTQAQVSVTDNTIGTISGTSGFFAIATALSGLTLDGGGTWVVGRPQQVQWTQTGSSTTMMIGLSLNGGGDNYPIAIGSQSVTGPFPVTKTAMFQPTAAQVTATAKVRVQDAESNHPTTQVESAPFTIDFAFKNIQPGGGSVLLVSPPNITWTTLLGPGIPAIASVKIFGIRADGSVALTIGPVSNSGSRSWTPPGAEEQFHIRVCDAAPPATVCADGQPFNIVSLSVSTDKTDYTLGNNMHITWSGADAITAVDVLFRPSDGSPDIDLLNGGTVTGATGQLDWTIDPTLSVPKSGKIHIQDHNATTTAGDSAATITLHGALNSVNPTTSSRWLINTPQTIAWNSTGQMTVRVEWATSAAGPFLLVSPGAGSILSTPGNNWTSWTPGSAAKSPTAMVKVTDIYDSTVSATWPSPSGFHVIGQLNVTQPAGGNFDIQTTPSLTIEWTTVGPMPTLRLRILDSSGAAIFQDSAVPNPPTQYTWSSVTTGQDLTVELCDAGDLSVCATSALFTVSGLKVDAPSAGQSFTLGLGGVSVPVQWRPVGGSGQANLFYQIGGGPLQAITSGVTSTESATNTLSPSWNIPTSFPTLSDQVHVVVKDVGGTPTGTSAPFAVKGAFGFTSPTAGSTYSVTDTVTIGWDTIGQITAVNLGWSTDGCATQTAIPVGSNVANGNTSVTWTLPVAAVSNNLRFCLSDAMAGHAPTTAMSDPITVGAKLAFTSPSGGELWASRAQHDVTWTTQGSVSQVKLEYSRDNFATATTITQTNNAGTFTWTVPDLKNLVADPQQAPSLTVTLRISDATPGHAPVPQVSSSLAIIYYKVDWEVRSATPPSPLLSALSVDDTSNWTISDFSANGQTTRYYPFGTSFSTIWSVKDVGGVVSQGSDENWVSDRDQRRVVLIELLSSEAVVWKVNAQYQYQTGSDPVDPSDDAVEIDSWLERTGKLVDNSDGLIESGKVEIFENGTLIRTFPAVAASLQLPDPSGLFKFVWDLKRDDGSAVADGATYFTKTTIKRNGRDFTSGGALNVTIPKKILTGGTGSGGGGLTSEQDTRLKNIEKGIGDTAGIVAGTQLNLVNAVNDIHAATVGGPGTNDSALEQIKNEVMGTAAPGDPETLRDLVTQTNTEVTGLNPDGTPASNSLKEHIIAIMEGEDPSVTNGFRGLRQFGTDVETREQAALDRLPAGQLLNRDTTVEEGQITMIQFRTKPGLPVPPELKVYGPSGGFLKSFSMAESSPGIYQTPVTFDTTLANSLSEGEYMVVAQVADQPALPGGALDSLAMRLTTKLAREGTVSNVITSLTNTLTSIDTRLGVYEQTMRNLQPLALATKDRAMKLMNDLSALSNDWTTDSPESLYTRLKNLADAIGTPAAGETIYSVANAAKGAADTAASAAGQARDRVGTPVGASLAVDVANLKQALDTVDGTQGVTMDSVKTRFDNLENLITGLPAVQAADQTQQLAAINETLAALAQDVTSMTGTSGNNLDAFFAQLNAIQAAVDALQTQGKTAQTDTLISKLDELQKTVASAQGSSAAVGLSQSAFSAASEAVKILQELQTQLRTGGADNAQLLLGQLGEKLNTVSTSVTVIPGKMSAEELSAQLKKLAEQARAVSSDKGYQFDSLYEISQTQSTDVKTVRNQVEELKTLLEIQRAILEQKVNQPVMKSWFEAN